MKVICFRHPDYVGTSSPVLSCKTCCALFLAELKRQHAAKGSAQADASQWLDDKAREAREAQGGQSEAKTNFGFNPTTI
jgi:hypothetical protein